MSTVHLFAFPGSVFLQNRFHFIMKLFWALPSPLECFSNITKDDVSPTVSLGNSNTGGILGLNAKL